MSALDWFLVIGAMLAVALGSQVLHAARLSTFEAKLRADLDTDLADIIAQLDDIITTETQSVIEAYLFANDK